MAITHPSSLIFDCMCMQQVVNLLEIFIFDIVTTLSKSWKYFPSLNEMLIDNQYYMNSSFFHKLFFIENIDEE